ncbi:MAG: glycosyl transferase [Bacteroidetes bacterium CG02_land_8_20_14_3_00_31_25]|nr:sugar transferase [Bacteroidota bacterium]PIV58669.1 MAG: glycosyl transferase [Bacteroidetes bacterium CG02_land_8_20_14_3_00_31_25]
MLKRFTDIFLSFLAILVLLPFMFVISLIVNFESIGGFFYFQQRVGKNGKDFKLIKFRTMYVGADKNGLITVGTNDKRITGFGKFLRKFKLDELPQLFNVIIGDMSIVGPRPEVRKYVNLYNSEQLKVLSVHPGLTDYASIIYIEENKILSESDDPEKMYVEKIMPHKLELNLKYIKNQTFFTDLKIIFETIFKIFF